MHTSVTRGGEGGRTATEVAVTTGHFVFLSRQRGEE